MLREFLLALPEQSALLQLCEHYDILDEIVMWDDPAGFRATARLLAGVLRPATQPPLELRQ